ncbi:hypothetical protein [Aquimarina rubra]|uniref:DUF2004 domain-containing protein n=1 Tax=Aquimarina rubra TaxID=1920033 RepID=A0ABW5LJ31_9FLAO
MKILDSIFGKKRKITDEFFGEIVSQRIKKENPNKEYTWYLDYLMSNGKEETQIILEGNFKTPNINQLEELKNIITNLPDLYTKMDSEVKKINLNKPSDKKLIVNKWHDEYYLSAVFPLEGQRPQFEICFDPIDDDNENLEYISLEYLNGEIKNMKF